MAYCPFSYSCCLISARGCVCAVHLWKIVYTGHWKLSLIESFCFWLLKKSFTNRPMDRHTLYKSCVLRLKSNSEHVRPNMIGIWVYLCYQFPSMIWTGSLGLSLCYFINIVLEKCCCASDKYRNHWQQNPPFHTVSLSGYSTPSTKTSTCAICEIAAVYHFYV